MIHASLIEQLEETERDAVRRALTTILRSGLIAAQQQVNFALAADSVAGAASESEALAALREYKQREGIIREFVFLCENQGE